MKKQTAQTEIINLLKDNPNYIDLNLDRIKKSLNLCKNPQHKYKVIHIAGTNGKGSTAAFIECGLINAGYKVGKYTSPYIKNVNEMICINNQPINDQDLINNIKILNNINKQNQIKLTFFEMITLIMFKYFADNKIDYLILECGMGGINDATNVVDAMIHIITNVGLEHTQYLGTTLSQIAMAKAGIIKNGYTILGDDNDELIKQVRLRTNNFICINELPHNVNTYSNKLNHFKQSISIEKQEYEINLAGKFQINNFLCAYLALKFLQIDIRHIKYAANNTIWHGRLQIINDTPLTIIDAMHNSHGARALITNIDINIFPKDKTVIICSILNDKDIVTILDILSNITTTIILTHIENNKRSTPIDDLAQIATNTNKFNQIFKSNSPNDALKIANQLSPNLIIICGSTYLLNYFLD